MSKPKIISCIKINGEWVNQDDVPSEFVEKLVEQALIRAGDNIGFEVTRITKEKSA